MTGPASNVYNLPPRPSASGGQAAPGPGAKAQSAQRARAHARGGAAAVAWVQSLASGASLLDAAPPAVMAVWALHAAAARHYQGWIGRWPRFAYGAWHAFALVPVLYFLAWVTDSLPKGLFSATVLGVLLWLSPLRLYVFVVPGHFWITL